MTYRLTITDHSGTELVNQTTEAPAGIITTTLQNLTQHSAGGRITVTVTVGADVLWICNWDLSEYDVAGRTEEIRDIARSLIGDVHWHADYASQFPALVRDS